jgi:phosphoribosylformimino-5-aminoimidazole carboxamide ribonucleotide (ProFAR) isomerase
VITGKALYSGAFTLEEALKAAGKDEPQRRGDRRE